MNPRHKFKPQISALCLLLLAVLFVACEADTLPFNLPPTLTVSEAENISRKGATISGTYTKANENVGVETFGLLYATNSLLGDADTIFATPAEITSGSYTATLSGLTPSTTYYYATFATSGSSIAKSDISHFTTSANSAPRLGDLVISELTASSCVLSTSVLDDGGSALTLRGFLYKKAPTNVSQLTIQDNQVNVSDDSEAFTATLSGLEENTRYAVCAYAVSADGIGYTKIEYITTAIHYIPILSSVSAQLTDVAGSLRVTAGVTSSGSAIIERGFVYSTETESPTVEYNKVIATGNDASFTATIANLPSDVPVYIRAYATTSDGIGYSETYTYNLSQMMTNTDVSAITAYTTEVENSFYVSASVTVAGTYAVTERGFTYSTDTQEPTADQNNRIVATGNDASFTSVITDLVQDRTNYIRAYVRTSAGYSYGETFVYNQNEWPVLTTGDVTNIWENTAKLNATINKRSSSINECGFLWSQSNTTPSLSDGKQTTTVSATLGAFVDGLTPNTKYYYRPFARHAKGITYGAVSSFTTTSDTGNVQRDTYGDDTEIE